MENHFFKKAKRITIFVLVIAELILSIIIQQKDALNQEFYIILEGMVTIALVFLIISMMHRMNATEKLYVENQDILNAAPFAFAKIDLKTNKVSVSKKFHKFFHYDKTPTFRKLLMLFDSLQSDYIKRVVKEGLVIESQKRDTFLFRHTNYEDAQITYYLQLYGRTLTIWFFDNSEDYRYRIKLSSLLDRYRNLAYISHLLLDHAPYMAWIKDGSDIVYANSKVFEILKLLNVVNATGLHSISHSHLQPFCSGFDDKNESNSSLQRTFIAQGKQLKMEVSRIVPDHMSDITCYVARDITEHINLSDGFRYQQTMIEELINTINDIIIIVDNEFIVHYINKAALKALSIDKKWLNDKSHFLNIFDKLQNSGILPETPDYSDYKANFINQIKDQKGSHHSTWNNRSGATFIFNCTPIFNHFSIITIKDISDEIDENTSHISYVKLFKQISNPSVKYILMHDGDIKYSNLFIEEDKEIVTRSSRFWTKLKQECTQDDLIEQIKISATNRDSNTINSYDLLTIADIRYQLSASSLPGKSFILLLEPIQQAEKAEDTDIIAQAN